MKADGYDGGLVGYDLLRYKIVELAIEDYKRCYKAYLKGKSSYKPYNGTQLFRVEDLERYFKSDGFNLLIGDTISGENLIAELRRQVKEELYGSAS